MTDVLIVDRPVSESSPEARFQAVCTASGCWGNKHLGRQYLLDRMGDIVPSSLNGRIRCSERRGERRQVCGSAMKVDVWFYETFKPLGPLDTPAA